MLFLSLSFLTIVKKIEKNPNDAKMNQEKVTKRLGSLIKIRPEYKERYIILHKHVFPEVLDRIRKSNSLLL